MTTTYNHQRRSDCNLIIFGITAQKEPPVCFFTIRYQAVGGTEDRTAITFLRSRPQARCHHSIHIRSPFGNSCFSHQVDGFTNATSGHVMRYFLRFVLHLAVICASCRHIGKKKYNLEEPDETYVTFVNFDFEEFVHGGNLGKSAIDPDGSLMQYSSRHITGDQVGPCCPNASILQSDQPTKKRPTP